MKEKKFLRDSLYIGQVHKNPYLVRNSNGLINLPFVGETRNILFQPSQNLLGVDLLNSHVSLYPILNFSNDEACFTTRRIRLYHKKVTLLDLKKFRKVNSYAIYKDALSMPENISRILQASSSFRPLKSEKISLR